MNEVSLDQISLATFARLKGTRFQVQLGKAGAVDLELAEVKSQTAHAPPNATGKGFECFSLRFNGPPAPQLQQDTFLFTHPEIGQFSLFMVPIARTQEGFQYEVVFNRLA